MTVSPIAPPPPGTGRGGASRSSSDTGFAALVERHLAAGQARPDEPNQAPTPADAAGSPGSHPGHAGTGEVETSGDPAGASAGGPSAVPGMPGATGPTAGAGADPRPETEPDAGGPEAASDVTAAQGLAVAGAAVTALSTPTVAAADGRTGARAVMTGPAVSAGAASTVQVEAADGSARETAAASTDASTTGAPATSGTQVAPAMSKDASTGEGTASSEGRTPSRGDAPPVARAARQADPQVPSPADATAPAATASQPAGAPQVAGTSQTVPATADVVTRPAVAGDGVTAQVFDHVTRLVSRGDGTHRLMLRLHPADLGEVKVVLTVRNNTVDVTLSAGPVARDALREGSPQLRALLELTGATAGQVVIRDHAGALAAHGATWTGSGQPGSGQPGAGQNGAGQNGAGQNGSGQSGAGHAGPGQQNVGDGSGQPGQGQHGGQTLGQQAATGGDGRSGLSGGEASLSGDPGSGALGPRPARAGRDPAEPPGVASASAGPPTYPQTATRLDLDL